MPALLHHLVLNIGCPKQLVLLLLLSSNEGRQIWSRVTGAGWWAMWACLASGSFCVGQCVCAFYLLIFHELFFFFWKTFVLSFVALLKNSNVCTVTRPHGGSDLEDWDGMKVSDGFSLVSWDLTIFDNKWLKYNLMAQTSLASNSWNRKF